MKVTVDRFEGETAVLLVRPEETQQILFPRALLQNVSEGEILELSVIRESEETDAARQRASALIERLRKKGA